MHRKKKVEDMSPEELKDMVKETRMKMTILKKELEKRKELRSVKKMTMNDVKGKERTSSQKKADAQNKAAMKKKANVPSKALKKNTLKIKGKNKCDCREFGSLVAYNKCLSNGNRSNDNGYRSNGSEVGIMF